VPGSRKSAIAYARFPKSGIPEVVETERQCGFQGLEDQMAGIGTTAGERMLRILLSVALATGAEAVKALADGKQANSVKINLDTAIEVPLPPVVSLRPVPFRTPDGKRGWVLRIPGNRPIATPAYADGLLFVGGGYGSHEFYAFDAKTGSLAWEIRTGDDGPTAAVVSDGYVGFNTESCTVIVAVEKTGKKVWQEWLGDPLMSQPAISKGRLFIAYPSGQRGPKHASPAGSATEGPDRGYRLLSVDLRSGKHLWEQEIPTDVISAPVVSGDHVYVACFDGTSLSFDASTGRPLWKKQGSATSAPIVVGDQLFLTRKLDEGASRYEGLMRVEAASGKDKDRQLLAKSAADYLAEGEDRSSALPMAAKKSLDEAVGFAVPPAAAKMAAASKNVGVNSVVGGWAYQGSRAAESEGKLFNVEGTFVNSVRAGDGISQWQAKITGRDVSQKYEMFSPPALGKQYMYLSSSTGHLISLRQQDGQVGFLYAFKKPMVFQPALVDGDVFVGTADGLLVCLETNTQDADGWYGWGGNAEHNK
jgi:Ca-activated chloride channel homolog